MECVLNLMAHRAKVIIGFLYRRGVNFEGHVFVPLQSARYVRRIAGTDTERWSWRSMWNGYSAEVSNQGSANCVYIVLCGYLSSDKLS